MDYDADGTLDFISGSYDPGDLYFFRGLGGGKYAKVIKILDENGTPLVHHPEELEKYERMRKDPDSDDDEEIQARVASFGSWASPVGSRSRTSASGSMSTTSDSRASRPLFRACGRSAATKTADWCGFPD